MGTAHKSQKCHLWIGLNPYRNRKKGTSALVLKQKTSRRERKVVFACDRAFQSDQMIGVCVSLKRTAAGGGSMWMSQKSSD